MNIANKLTMLRIFLTVVLIGILLFPFDMVNVEFPVYTLEYLGNIVVINLKYIIAAVIFAVASITDFLDGHIARKYNMVTDFGKLVDAIADKMLVNSTLIILSSQGYVSPIITVIIIFRDTVVDTIRMLAASKGRVVAAGKTGKIKTTFLMFGIVIMLCHNLPFEFFNLDIANFLLVLATIFSVISGIQYYVMNKELIFENDIKKEKEEKNKEKKESK